jgi:hypothetical protein
LCLHGALLIIKIWHLSILYRDPVELIGHRAREFNDAFYVQRDNARNRMEREFLQKFCHENGSIDWPKLVTLVSKNVA